MRTHQGRPCPDETGDYCAVCERAVDAAEDARYGLAVAGEWQVGQDRYERELDRRGEA